MKPSAIFMPRRSPRNAAHYHTENSPKSVHTQEAHIQRASIVSIFTHAAFLTTCISTQVLLLRIRRVFAAFCASAYCYFPYNHLENKNIHENPHVLVTSIKHTSLMFSSNKNRQISILLNQQRTQRIFAKKTVTFLQANRSLSSSYYTIAERHVELFRSRKTTNVFAYKPLEKVCR